MDITIHIPAELAKSLKAEARAQKKTVEDVAAERLARSLLIPNADKGVSYVSLFGAARGRPGAFGSAEAIDRYLDEQRAEW